MTLAAALPVLAWAAVVDQQRGFEVAGLLTGAAVALVCLLALSRAADRWTPLGRGVWLAVLLALPILVAVLGWNDAPEGAPTWLEWAARVSPLRWAYDLSAGGAPPTAIEHALPVIFVLALLALTGQEPADA